MVTEHGGLTGLSIDCCAARTDFGQFCGYVSSYVPGACMDSGGRGRDMNPANVAQVPVSQ